VISATPFRYHRSAAISSSTIFAIALAIVAGLIFAWMFKMVLLDPKKTPPPVDTRREITLATVNILGNTQVAPMNVKVVKVSQEQYDRLMKYDADGKPRISGDRMLTGQQPVGRVTKKSVIADMPYFASDMEPFEYPKPVSDLLQPGKKAVIVSVAPTEAMVQVNDVVDVWATLSNDALGAGGNGSAVIARNAKVVARFGTTAPGARPANAKDPRQYTLEVSPYRFALIELAKVLGAKFSLAVSHPDGSSDVTEVSTDSSSGEPTGDQLVRVTGADLARLFGISPPANPPPSWSLEKIVGIRHAGTMTFPAYQPHQGPTVPVSTSPGNEGNNGGGGGIAPAAYAGPPGAKNAGFKAPGGGKKPDCPNCGLKN
jgi:Flp pilus assembly protein CpaB